MKKLKRLFNSTIVMMMAVLCAANISSSANYYVSYNDNIHVDTDSFRYIIDNDTLTATIIDIKPGTKTFTIPDTVVFDKVYPVKSLNIPINEDEIYSDFGSTLETINVGINTKEIRLGENTLTAALKNINIPAGSKLTMLWLPRCPKLVNINLPSDSILKDISISGCPKLKELSLPKSLKYFDLGYDAPNLKIKIAKNNKFLKARGNQILSKDGKKLIGIVGNKRNVKVYKTVNVIDNNSVRNKYLRKLTIGKNITKFALGSFNICPKIKIIIKNKYKAPKIKAYAFDYAKKGISFYVENINVANDLKEKLKGSKIKKAKILIGKKVVYKNVKG